LKDAITFGHLFSTVLSRIRSVATGVLAMARTWNITSVTAYIPMVFTTSMRRRETKEPKKPMRRKIFLFPRLSERFPQKIRAGTEAAEAMEEMVPTSTTLA
jgi:hypothetical protein